MDFFLKIIVFLLIFIFPIIYLKQKKIKKSQNNKIYPDFIITKNSSSFKHVMHTKEGELISFQCQGEIECMGYSNYNDFLLNSNFYQKNYIKYINKCLEIKMADS